MHISSSLLKVDQSNLRTWQVTLELSMLKSLFKLSKECNCFNHVDMLQAYLTLFQVMLSSIWQHIAVLGKVVLQTCARQCRKVLQGLLDWSLMYFIVTEGNSINTCIDAFPSWNTVNVKERQNITTHNWHSTNRHCSIRFYACVGQPLPKQLYTAR